MAKLTIDEMQDKLEALAPILEIKSKEVEAIMYRLQSESKEVMEMKEKVDIEA